MSLRSHVLVPALAVAAATSVLLGGCASNKEGGAGPTGSATPTVTKDTSLNALLPAKIKSAGKLIVGVNVPYSPNEFIQNGKVVGFDVDLVDATAKKLGLTTVYRQAAFEKIIPSVKGDTYDLGMSSFSDTLEREKSVDFVTYFSAGILWAAHKGRPVVPTNACGLTVAVQSNTTEQQDQLPKLSKACTKAGKKPIKILAYTSQDDATNAVVLGKAAAISADSPVTAYAIKQSAGKLAPAGKITDAYKYGWPIKKGSTLVKAMQKALQALIADGSYAKICKKWGLQSGEIKTAGVNGATS
ncbi:MAG: ABC transporter substrate-binding protein [Actinomycetota bacterium]|nr:ABC transporter substrate-binding protein [Actinomycetota bacterium]